MLPSFLKIKILVKCREYSTLGLKGLLILEIVSKLDFMYHSTVIYIANIIFYYLHTYLFANYWDFLGVTLHSIIFILVKAVKCRPFQTLKRICAQISLQ